MAPKAAPAKGKPALKKEGTKGNVKEEAGGAVAAGDDEVPAATLNMAAPTSKDEVLAQVNLEGLPHCPVEQINELLKGAPLHAAPSA